MNEWTPCELCGQTAVDRHHVFFGAKCRHWAEKYGLVAPLCRRCHAHVHADRQTDLRLKVKYQTQFEQEFGHELWMRVFGRSYL